MKCCVVVVVVFVFAVCMLFTIDRWVWKRVSERDIARERDRCLAHISCKLVSLIVTRGANLFKFGANGTRLTGSVAVVVDTTSSGCPLGTSGGAVAAGTGEVAAGAVAVAVADVVASLVASLVSLAAAKMALPFCQLAFY